MEHAKAFAESTLETLKSSFNRILPNRGVNATFPITIESSGLEDALKNVYFLFSFNHLNIFIFLYFVNCFSKSIELELVKYSETQKEVVQRLPEIDLRLNHILSYFSCNSTSRELRVLALYDLFRIQVFSDNLIKLKLMQTLAQIKYNEYVLASLTNVSGSTTENSNPEIFKFYEKWQADYRDLRSIIAAFISAASHLEFQR